MSKFSVKKPFTVLVAVVIVLVLGYVSLTKMTPDLLPNMDTPYAIVMTTYPGASPEKVEATVTKPLEQTLATLENIENIQSSSSENYSMIMLEFNSDVNMDTVGVDISQKIDLIEGAWDDAIGTPYVLKINPTMLPVGVASIDMDDTDITELSTLVNDEILPKLEGTAGVASITATGIVEEKLNVVINQEKIDEANKLVTNAINGQFDDSKAELDDAKAEVDKNKSDLESGKQALDSAKAQLSEKISEAEGQLDQKQRELLEGKIEIREGIVQLQQALADLEEQEKLLLEVNNQIKQLEGTKRKLENNINTLEQIQAQAPSVSATCQYYEQQIEAIKNDSSLTDEEKQIEIDKINNQPEYITAKAELAKINAQLKALGVDSIASIPAAIESYRAQLAAANLSLEAVDAVLSQMDMTRDDVQAAVDEIAAGKKQIKNQITQLETTLEQLESGEIALNEAMITLNKQKISSTIELSANTAQLLTGQAALESASAEIDKGYDTIEDAQEQALKKADLNNIITMDMISTILTAQNFSMPAGYIKEDGIQYMVSVGDKLESIDDINNLLLMDLGIDGLDPIYLYDVADVFMMDNSDSIYAKINGNNGILLSFQKQSTYATATVSDNLSAKFEQLENEYPGLHFVSLMDQGDYIYMIIESIVSSLLWGAVFAIIVLFLFLRDIRPTIITICSIPISILFAIVLMYFSGISLNIISLSGLAIAVGMLVDNSVVVIENIYRLRNMGVSPVKAAISGATQVAAAITGSTLTTVCVFLPIVFVEGITRQLFTDMALTLAYSLLASLIIALTLVPTMSSAMLKNIKPKQHKFQDMALDWYEKLLKFTLNHKVYVLAGAVVLLILSCVLAGMKGFSFMPAMQSTQISTSIEMPEDAEFEEIKEMSDQVIDTIGQVDGVETVGAMQSSGSSLLSLGSSNTQSVDLYIILDEASKRPIKEITDEINQRCADFDCTVDVSAESTMSSMTSMLGGSGVSVNVYGDDLEQLQEAAQQVADVVYTVKGTDNISNGIEDNAPAIHFVVNKNKAMAEGLTVAQVYMELSKAITTETTSTTIDMDSNSYSVIVKNDKEDKLDLDYLKNHKITVTNTQGEEKEIAIKDITDIVETETLSTIKRDNQKRYITVTAEVKEGYNVTNVSSDVEAALEKATLPDGITYETAGESETIMASMKDLFSMLLLGILFVYLVMVAQFQSLKSPFIVMFTIPLAFTGGLLALLICGMDISVIAMLGFIMLSGIIVNNGIVLVDSINQLRVEGMAKREAIIESCRTRLRPILITSLTTILGLIVMAMGVGTGSELMQPIAIVCIGGLLYATLLTLFVVPIIYEIFNRKETINTISNEDLEITNE